ncbi:MAG: DUF427 domain-containing protein [Chloroflexota bacterium]
MTHETKLPGAEHDIVDIPKWIRVYLGGELVASSRRVKLKRGWPMSYFFPLEDVSDNVLVPENENGTLWTVKAGDAVARRAAWADDDPKLADYVAFKWHEMDAWFEEDEEVRVHPRDPYTRIDVLPSSRRVRVEIAGETVADTRRPVLLFETGLPIRYYIPKMDVRRDLLVPSDKQTGCPYKGYASYYSVRVGQTLAEDIVWYYPFPEPEVARIQGLLAFYQERADGFYVDE